MKKLFFSALVALGCAAGYSQQDARIDYGGELVKSVKVPQSPEATAFQKYGDVAVSMYTGQPNISIPLYTISGREMNLPLTLSYDASGIKVESVASHIGQGWNLIAGGRVVRSVNGLPDDSVVGGTLLYSTLYDSTVRNNISDYTVNYTGIFSSTNAVTDYITFLRDIKNNKIDAQPDYFSATAPGLSEQIGYDSNMNLIALNNPMVKVEKAGSSIGVNSFTGIKITKEDGTIYHFMQYERTKTEGDNGSIDESGTTKQYISSWYLTKIESPNKKDVYDFSYPTSTGYWQQPLPVAASSVTNTPDPNSTATYVSTVNSQVTYSPNVFLDQRFLSSISHNNRTIVSLSYVSDRVDLNDLSSTQNEEKRLDLITINRPNGTGVTPLKKYKFLQTYFGATDLAHATSQNHKEVRLKLDGIEIQNASGAKLNSYELEYYSPLDVAPRNSLDRDYLGYANAANNSVLYPQITLGNVTYAGADRDPDFNNAVKGNLKKIIYPTGGSSEFQYGLHQTTDTSSSSGFSDVTYGNKILSGGTGSSSDCGACCQDKFLGNGPYPRVQSTTFEITEADNYDVSYFLQSYSGSSSFVEAYIIPIANSSSTVSYFNLLDLTFCSANSAVYSKMTCPNLRNIYGDPIKESIFLSAGHYQIMLVNQVSGLTAQLKVTRREWNSSSGNSNVAKAGLRIEKIINDAGNGSIPVTKTYQYTLGINSSVSSGKTVWNPRLYSISKVPVSLGSANSVDYSILTRNSGASGGTQPHVAYSQVIEKTDHDGYTVHSFSVGADGVQAQSLSPYASSYRKDHKPAKEYLTKTYDKENNLLLTNTNTFDNFEVIDSSLGLTIGNDPDLANMFYYREYIGGQYYLKTGNLTHSAMSSPSLGFSGFTTPNFPSYCGSSNIHCYGETQYQDVMMQKIPTIVSGRAGGVIQSSTINTQMMNVNPGGQPLVGPVDSKNHTFYTYDGGPYYQLRDIVTTDSLGVTTKVVNHYTSDFYDYSGNDTASLEYQDMSLDFNRMNTVVKNEYYRNNVKTGTTQTVFKDWGNDQFMPEIMKSSKSTLTLEDRLVYHSYDPEGNLQEVSLKDGPRTVYIWGYNYKYPVAKIENATYSEIPSYIVTNIRNRSNADSDRTIGLAGTEGLLRTEFNNLRNVSALSDALITTYTYDPEIGVTSITDPSGQTIYYDYDVHHRLQYVLDKDGKVLSKNEYNYKK